VGNYGGAWDRLDDPLIVTGSWLCRDDLDRERLLDMENHLRPVRVATMAVIVVSLLASAAFISALVFIAALIGVAVALGLFRLADAYAVRTERPEYVMFAAWTGAEMVIALCVVLSGGPDSPAVAWLAIPVVTLASRFSMRGVVLGVAIAFGLLLAATLGVDPGAVIDDPTVVSAPAVLIFTIAILSIALMRSDLHHRGAAVIDPLTGMLNRKALATRVEELEQQSRVSGQPVGLIMGDLDNFKRVNDSRGHAAGDAVLKDIAYQLRKQLRAFDLAYRIGGEEFLIVVPGADAPRCAAVAEELRRRIAESTFGDGVELTMSFGVSASAAGGEFDYTEVFAGADAALYEAKELGRNRVCQRLAAAAASPPTEAPAAAPGLVTS
jgi:diguanylate cyclase (GGDEF)-like protein